MARTWRDRSEPTTILLSALTILATLAVTPAVLNAQSSDVPTFATRDQLHERAAQLEERLQGSSLTEEARAQIRSELSRVQTRLEEGDFHPGDVVALDVWDNEELTGTFTVGSQRQLQLPALDPVDLEGVLYSESDSVIREHLSRYLRDVRVEVRPMKRVAVLGAVNSPGFYDLQPSASVADALMAAGGPAQNAELDEMELRRDGTNVLEHPSAEVQTMTLEQLALRRGDQFFVPQGGEGLSFGAVVGVISALGTTAFAITRIF